MKRLCGLTAMQLAPNIVAGKTVWRNARLATMADGRPGLGIVERGAIAAQNGRIVYAGAEADLPAAVLEEATIIDCSGRWITPGLIDCHTHLVHAGHRAQEFEQRLNGIRYGEIAAAGGGIASSVKALRQANQAELVRQSLPRLKALMAEGVTTIEMKTGYGLDLTNERKSLLAMRQLGQEHRVTIQATFLGAHVVAPEFAGNQDGYISAIVSHILPTLAAEGLVDAVDGFCESIAFSTQEIARVFVAAQALGLPVKLHADQLCNSQGAALAASFDALSADHLEYADEAGVVAMAKSGTVAVMLPAAFYYIHEKQVPPISLFRAHGVPMAVATDCNPGTAPLSSLLLAMNMTATLFGMNVEECLLGTTRHAAKALGLLNQIGTLEAGKWADLAIWNIERPAQLVANISFNPLHMRVWRGL